MRRLRALTASLLLGVLLAALLPGLGPRPARAADDLAAKEEALRQAEEALKKLRGALVEAQREQEEADRAAHEVMQKLLKPDEYAQMKEASAKVLQLAGVGMTLYAMGPVLALPFLVKMFASGAALEALRITTEDIQEMQTARHTVGDKKIEKLAAEKKVAESRLASEQAGVCVAQNEWASRTVASLGGGGVPAGSTPGPAAPTLTAILPKDQYVQVDTDVDFSVVVKGGTPPYALRITSQAFEVFEARIDADGGRLDRKLRFRQEGVYSVLVGVVDDAVSGKQTKSATVVYNVRTDPVRPPADTGGGPLALVLPKGGDVEVGKDVDLSIVVRGGRPPYRLRVTAPGLDPIEGPLEASGDTFQRILRFPQAGTYRVEVGAADEALPNPGVASGAVVFTAKAGPVPPPGAAPGTLDLVLPTGVLPAMAGKPVKLPIRVSGGAPPYLVEVRSNVPHDVRQAVGTSGAGDAGATFEPDLVFPQPGRYAVDVRVDDDAPARQRQTRSGSVQFRVTEARAGTGAPLASLKIDPPSVTLGVGDSQRFEAIATTRDAGEARVSDLVRWTPGPVFHASRPGTFKVTAEMAGQVATAEVTVQDATSAGAFSLRIEPETLTLEVGQSQRLEALQVFPGRPDAPSVSDEATWDGVDAGHTFRADRAGSYLVTATYKGVKGRATITVTAPRAAPRAPLTARLECGGLLELRPGAVSTSCGVIVEGWRSDTAERVEVEVTGLGSGVQAFPGSTSNAPANMYNPGVADDKGSYVFGEGFQARADAPPGTTTVAITVRQRGAGEVRLSLNVSVLRKGLLPSSGPGIRPPAEVAPGSGGEFCVWRYKLFGDPPACFHFVAAECTTPRYTNPRNGYELVGASMTFGEADGRMRDLSRHFENNYGCGVTAAKPPDPPPGGGDEPPPGTPQGGTGEPPKEPPVTEEPPGPKGPVLTRFGISCAPVTIRVGETARCSAVGEYSDRPGVYVDLTGTASWSGGPDVAGQREGTVQVSAAVGDASDSTTVTVEAGQAGASGGGYDPRGDPNVRDGGTGMAGGAGTPGGPGPAGAGTPGGPGAAGGPGAVGGAGGGTPGSGESGNKGLGGGTEVAQEPGYTGAGPGQGTGAGQGGGAGAAPGATPGAGVVPGTPGGWPWPGGPGLPGGPLCWNPQTQRAEPCGPRTGSGQTPPRWAGVVPPSRTPRSGGGGPTGTPMPPTGGGQGGGSTGTPPPTVAPPPTPTTPPPPTTPPVTTPPPTTPPATPPPATPPSVAGPATPPAQTGDCDDPVCRELCMANCESYIGGASPWCTNGCAGRPSCGRSNFSLAQVKAACYANMLLRCQQGEAGRNGNWCVKKGSQPTCEAKAMSVCGCDAAKNPGCGGKWESWLGPSPRVTGAARWSSGSGLTCDATSAR